MVANALILHFEVLWQRFDYSDSLVILEDLVVTLPPPLLMNNEIVLSFVCSIKTIFWNLPRLVPNLYSYLATMGRFEKNGTELLSRLFCTFGVEWTV